MHSAEVADQGATLLALYDRPAPGVALHHYVPDADRTFARAVELGATPLREVADSPYGHRGGVLRDPFGHRRFVQTQTQIDDIDQGLRFDLFRPRAGY